jgi:hypothetical protein
VDHITSAHLVVGRPEPPADVLVVQHLDLEGEVLLEVLDDHHQEGQLDPQRRLRVCRACDVVGAHVGAHYLQDAALDVAVRDALDVPILNCSRERRRSGLT